MSKGSKGKTMIKGGPKASVKKGSTKGGEKSTGDQSFPKHSTSFGVEGPVSNGYSPDPSSQKSN